MFAMFLTNGFAHFTIFILFKRSWNLDGRKNICHKIVEKYELLTGNKQTNKRSSFAVSASKHHRPKQWNENKAVDCRETENGASIKRYLQSASYLELKCIATCSILMLLAFLTRNEYIYVRLHNDFTFQLCLCPIFCLHFTNSLSFRYDSTQN